MNLGWYWHRLTRMSPHEVCGRMRVAAQQRYWAAPRRRPNFLDQVLPAKPLRSAVRLSRIGEIECAATARVIAAAEALLAGCWPVFDIERDDVAAEPDWFLDPLTGIHSPRDVYAFRIQHRNEALVGNVKHVWEPSRHQPTTLLACAWWLTGNTKYADRVAAHLRSWWRDNLFLEGIHWTSGIEVGLRLLSWTWIRALLADWEGCNDLFDGNDHFVAQLYQHQRYLAAFQSIGSSANNHLIAELAGLAVASTVFPWFTSSSLWEEQASRQLVREAERQTHADGFNREQASDYHIFVFEILMAASLLVTLAGKPFPPAFGTILQGMADALAASMDQTGRPPRFGDGDDGRGVLLDASGTDQSAALLGAAGILFGHAPWWPDAARQPSVLAVIAAQIHPIAAKPRQVPRPDLFPDCGQAILRAGEGLNEVWLRCDHGPLGYQSIAAHGHADALSIELRCGGVDLLADPGTYCYHGETAWRRYFKGTIGHNTLSVAGRDQARYGGPFLWLSQPTSSLEHCSLGSDLGVQVWQARHDGYRRLGDKVTHHRNVVLDAGACKVSIRDWIESTRSHPVSLAFHFGPTIHASLFGTCLQLCWAGRTARLHLPDTLQWRLCRGESDPPLGWYSARFGHKTPAFVAVGEGHLSPGQQLLTRLDLQAAMTNALVNRKQSWSNVQLVS